MIVTDTPVIIENRPAADIIRAARRREVLYLNPACAARQTQPRLFGC